MTPLPAMRAVLYSRLASGIRSWPMTMENFAVAFSSAQRTLGKAQLALHPFEQAALRAAGVDWPLTTWGIDDAERVVMLLEAAEQLNGAELQALAQTTYVQGDSREKAAVLRALPLLGEPERFLAIAIEASKSSVLTVFEAIACENPWPSAHFPELSFNELVSNAERLKVPLSRILGLEWRRAPARERPVL
jgi:hypothetical protein